VYLHDGDTDSSGIQVLLDLTSCSRPTDHAIGRIIDVAPHLRNLVITRSRNITDVAVNTISKLGKSLHYIQLGHCNHITDEVVIKLVRCCNRIRYIDLSSCFKLTYVSVTKLATLPKLRCISLVKCNTIANDIVYALSQLHRRYFHGGAGQPELAYTGLISANERGLERVHISYCTNLTLRVRIFHFVVLRITNRD
jgi:F-box and leucine-rich repeat protein GRR1